MTDGLNGWRDIASGEPLWLFGESTVEHRWLVKRRWWQVWMPRYYEVGSVEHFGPPPPIEKDGK